jgi:3-oxoadipate enol-lactonase
MTAALRHDVAGPPDAPTVVLSNSLGTTSMMWSAQAASLASRFRVVTFDTRGHGDSDSPPPPWTIDDLGNDVLALLDGLGLDRVAFAGVSLGGMLGMWLAVNAPQRVNRLVLICTSARVAAPDAYLQRATWVRANGIEPIVDAVVERWFTPTFARQHPHVVQDYKEMLAKSPVDGYASCCEAIAHMDLRADIGGIAAPTLVISGADDLAIPPSHGAAIAAAIPGASFVVVAGAAHLANVEQPDDVTTLLFEHLQEKE